jgi:hypothetical protein
VLRSIDRIEVRGRDSAGISVCLSNIVLDDVAKKQIAKSNHENFTNNSVRFVNNGQINYFLFINAQLKLVNLAIILNISVILL